MLGPVPAALALLLASASVIEAQHGTGLGSSRHRRHAGVLKRLGAAPHTELDIHGRQIRPVVMKRDADQNHCRVRPQPTAAALSISVAAGAPSSSAVQTTTSPSASSAASASTSSETAAEFLSSSSTEDVATTTVSPIAATTVSPVAATTASPVAATTASPVAATTVSPVAATTAAPVAASITASQQQTQEQPPKEQPTTSQQTQAASTSAAPPVSNGGNTELTPNGKKAGIAGGDSYTDMKDHIGWWYDWSPTPSKPGSPIGVSMLWGGGHADGTDSQRLSTFRSINWAPKYVLGFEEPDCSAGSSSSGIDVGTGVALWNELVGPLKAKGSLLASPSMCKQAAESGWLGPFRDQINIPWDITNIHVNKNNMDGVRKDIDHYWNTYGKPIWVTEFACVDDNNGFTPCTDQGEINRYINDIVDLFESDDRVKAYAYSDGYGLGDVWPTYRNGQLSESGRTYLNAISKYH